MRVSLLNVGKFLSLSFSLNEGAGKQQTGCPGEGSPIILPNQPTATGFRRLCCRCIFEKILEPLYLYVIMNLNTIDFLHINLPFRGFLLRPNQ